MSDLISLRRYIVLVVAWICASVFAELDWRAVYIGLVAAL